MHVLMYINKADEGAELVHHLRGSNRRGGKRLLGAPAAPMRFLPGLDHSLPALCWGRTLSIPQNAPFLMIKSFCITSDQPPRFQRCWSSSEEAEEGHYSHGQCYNLSLHNSSWSDSICMIQRSCEMIPYGCVEGIQGDRGAIEA